MRTRIKKGLMVGIVFGVLCLTPSVWCEMPMNEANRTYSVRFQDWVYVYLNNEFTHAAPPAPDYNLSVKPKVINNKLQFVISGYYFNTKLGEDWYRRYGSKLESNLAMLCHSWTQQGYPISPDDFIIEIREEKMESGR